jgi:hypothetical protein
MAVMVATPAMTATPPTNSTENAIETSVSLSARRAVPTWGGPLIRMIRRLKRAAILGLALAVLAAPAFAQTAAQHPVNPQTRSTGGGAEMSCPGDKVVWVNTKSGIYHFKGERWFGNTQQGKYMCEHAADAEGDRPTHNGQ